MTTDRFGNVLDPGVGYARGRLLGSSTDEVRRLRHAQRVAGRRVRDHGPDSIGVFTGNPRYFPIQRDDLNTLCEEWVGPGLFSDDLATAARSHLGGGPEDAVAVFNRTSAGIVAAVLALSGERAVVSVVPTGDRSHASVVRGCRMAGVDLVEITPDDDPGAAMETHRPALVAVTTVTSALARLDDTDTRAAIDAAHSVGATVLMDEAYGARLRPVLHGGALSLALGGDVAITNADKAGLSGPRAGVMAGRADAVVATLAKASEFGMEARAPIAVGAMRSLQGFDPQLLRDEARDGQAVADALAELLGAGVVVRSDLGPMVDEQDVLAAILRRAGRETADIVPAEVTAAAGMLMLRDHGILTVNTHGQPGGRVSIRLKPTAGAVDRAGGPGALAQAVDRALDTVADNIGDTAWFHSILFGDSDT